MPSSQTFGSDIVTYLTDDDGAFLTDDDGTLLREDFMQITWRRRLVSSLASLLPARDVGGTPR